MNMLRLRPTVEGELIKRAGTISALRSHQWDKPEWTLRSSLRRTNHHMSYAFTNNHIEASSERGEMFKRGGSISISHRKSAQCQFTVKRSTSILSRSSSGSVSLNEKGGCVMHNSVERREQQPRESNSCENTGSTFDRKKVLRTTSRGARLVRGESLRKSNKSKLNMNSLC
jgi:hypothetical protein